MAVEAHRLYDIRATGEAEFFRAMEEGVNDLSADVVALQRKLSEEKTAGRIDSGDAEVCDEALEDTIRRYEEVQGFASSYGATKQSREWHTVRLNIWEGYRNIERCWQRLVTKGVSLGISGVEYTQRILAKIDSNAFYKTVVALEQKAWNFTKMY